MPTRNANGRSRRLHNGWPVPTEVGAVYTLHFANGIHYTGFSREECLASRLSAHWDGRCDVKMVLAFRRVGIPFVVVAIERGVTRFRENQLKLHGTARRCPICKGRRKDAESRELSEGRESPSLAGSASGLSRHAPPSPAVAR